MRQTAAVHPVPGPRAFRVIRSPVVVLLVALWVVAGPAPTTHAQAGKQPAIVLEGGITPREAFTEDLRGILQQGNNLLAEGKFEDALTAFRQGPSDDAAFALGIGLANWKLGRFSEAAPHLRHARRFFPHHVGLQKALHEVDLAIIETLELQRRQTYNAERKVLLARQLGPLYEETSHYGKAARRFAEALPANPDEEALLHVADLFKEAKSFTTAADYYLRAGKLSQAPNQHMMWAVDCYLLAKRWRLAEDLLNHLKSVYPVPELDWYWARLYRGKRDPELADRTLRMLGGYYEKEARRRKNRRQNLLKAAEAYLDGNHPTKGLAILERLAAQSPARQPDIDQLRGDYFFRTKQYQTAIDIYALHPNSIPMQVSHGWAHFHQGQPYQAHQHFKDLQQRYPHHPEVLAGWRNMAYYRPWMFSYIYTKADYGDFQDDRHLHTGSVTHRWGRFAATLVYTGTDADETEGVKRFHEDLFAGRVYRKLGDESGMQFHVLHFQNIDPVTDNGLVLGGKYMDFPRGKFHWDAEMNASMYSKLSAFQTALGLTYRFDEHWSSSIGLDAGFLNGSDANVAATRTPIGFRVSFGFQDQNAHVTLAGWVGERILMVDSAALYANNSLDNYREGASITVLQKGPAFEFYVKFAGAQVTSQALRERNMRRSPAVDPDYMEKKGSIGVNVRFF